VAFPISAALSLLVGESADGENHTFLLDGSTPTPTLTERPLRVRRKGATGVTLPNGQIAIVGGSTVETGAAASALELYFP
jgi:hypothetical protein